MKMTRHLILVLCCLSLESAAWAAGAVQRDPTRLSILAHTSLGKDFRITFHLEKNVQICGGEGDAYVGQVEMNKPERAMGDDGHVTLKDHWVKVDKSYSIFVSELSEPNPQLFDNNACLE
jgi:hypothetical protein